MIERSTAAVTLVLALALALAVPACGATKAPKQVEAPDALADKGSADISSGEDSSGNSKAAVGGEEKMHAKCCGQCKEGLAKDRTGAAATTIPCADFTDTLDPLCLEHFRGKKTMASECK
jgi:hypothetical protein